MSAAVMAVGAGWRKRGGREARRMSAMMTAAGAAGQSGSRGMVGPVASISSAVDAQSCAPISGMLRPRQIFRARRSEISL